MQNKINNLFGNFLSNLEDNESEMINGIPTKYRKAFTDFKETNKEFIIEIEIPGIEKKDIQLNIKDKSIEIKAEKKQEKRNKKNKEYVYSKSYAGFYQTFNVPDNTDLKNIDAFYKNGVLTIKLPKKINFKNKKTIKIK